MSYFTSPLFFLFFPSYHRLGLFANAFILEKTDAFSYFALAKRKPGADNKAEVIKK